MKRWTLIIILIIYIMPFCAININVYGDNIENNNIERFAKQCIEIANEHDKGMLFESASNDTLINDDVKFQTGRLFVKCTSSFNKMGAEEKVSGFLSWHLLQYASPQDAKKAYEYYLKQDEIECVEIDNVFAVEENNSSNSKDCSKDDFQNDYSRINLGFDEVLQYINNHKIDTKEIKVGVIDSGIDYNHPVFRERLFRTNYNAMNLEDDQGEYDDIIGHGTLVSSLIVLNTPQTVKVGCYKTFNENGDELTVKLSYLYSSLIRAWQDNCQVINMSFGTPVSSLIDDTLSFLRENDIAMFNSAGNGYVHRVYGEDIHSQLHGSPYLVVVGAVDQGNQPARFSNDGQNVSFMAPGTDIAGAYPHNKYIRQSGTSFSAPLASALYSIILSLNTGFDYEKIIDLISFTCMDYVRPYVKEEEWFGKAYYGSGVIDATGAFCEALHLPRTSKVTFSLESGGNYHSGDKLFLYSDDNATIYYTDSLKLPNRYNWKKYTNPIEIDGLTHINAVAICEGKFQSQNAYGYFRGFNVGTSDMFSITEDGTVTSYTGTFDYLEIPENINGITVKSVHSDLFSKKCIHMDDGYESSSVNVRALKLPDTVEYIEETDRIHSHGLCWSNDKLEYFYAKNLKNISPGMFYKCSGLIMVDIPCVRTVGYMAFKGCDVLSCLELPAVNFADEYAFDANICRILDLSNLTEISSYSLTGQYGYVFLNHLKNVVTEDGDSTLFDGSANVATLFLPELETISKYDFEGAHIERLELSSVKEMQSFPLYAVFNPPKKDYICKLLLPSTLKSIDLSFTQNNGISYVIYGTNGSYAQQWAKENGIAFVEFTQDTAIVTDVRETCNEYTQMLFFDSLGFNKTYQWYGNFEESTENGIPLDGATRELLQLQNYKSYPYYYCICTSTDIDESESFEHYELIYSKICGNADYQPADYTEYKKAVDKAIALDRSKYKDFTGIDEALAVDVSNLSAAEQSTVDEQTKVILEAIAELELIEEPSTDTTETTTSESSTDELESTTENTTEQDETTKASTEDGTTTEYESTTISTATTDIHQTTIRRDTSLTSPNTGEKDVSMIAVSISLFILLYIVKLHVKIERKT